MSRRRGTAAPPPAPAPDWHALAERTGLDPYLSWALATRWRAMGSGAGVCSLAWAVELRAPGDWAALVDRQPSVTVPGLYAAGDPDGRFGTLRLAVPADDPGAQAAAVYALLTDPALVRAQIGLASAHPPASQPVSPTADAPPPEPAPALPHGVLLGLVDDACPVAHQALRDDQGRSRVLALWDQGQRPGLPGWHPAAGACEGAELRAGEVDAAIARFGGAPDLDEAALYGRGGLRLDEPARRASHGAAVASLLAGRLGALPPRPLPGALPPGTDGPSHPLPAADDAAAGMRLAAVRFPRRLVLTTSGRWLSVNALDALHYLRAARRRFRARHVVVNLSFGGHAGAHDGTSLLKSAFDDLLRRDSSVRLVLPAGNGHGTARDPDTGVAAPPRLPGGVHACLPRLAPGAAGRFLLAVPPDKQFETYLELWFSQARQAPGAPVDQHLAPGLVELRVRAPSRAGLSATFPGTDLLRHDGEPIAGLVCWPRVPQSRHRSMALVVLAPTQVSSRRPEAPAGLWEVQVRLGAEAAEAWRVDAWVERDDTVVGARRGQAARLVQGDGPGDAVLDDQGSFSNIANGQAPLVAGALVARDPGRPGGLGEASPYAAAAWRPGGGPAYSAVADGSPAGPGIQVAGQLSGQQVRANGASLAAPWVARQLANQLAGAGALPRPIVLSPRQGTTLP